MHAALLTGKLVRARRTQCKVSLTQALLENPTHYVAWLLECLNKSSRCAMPSPPLLAWFSLLTNFALVLVLKDQSDMLVAVEVGEVACLRAN